MFKEMKHHIKTLDEFKKQKSTRKIAAKITITFMLLEHVALATSIDQEWEGAKVSLADYACGKRFRI